MAENKRFADAVAEGFLSAGRLKKDLRLKPGPDTERVTVWQGIGWLVLYKVDQCVPMQPRRPPTDRQREVLAAGRAVRGTVGCKTCGHRWPKESQGACDKCARKDAIESAKAWLSDSTTVVLDTETTGLGADAEILEISIISIDGSVLLNTLVKPVSESWDEAQEIHGISPADVAGAPSWPDIHGEVSKILEGRRVIIYNSQYDSRILQQSAIRHGLRPTVVTAECAMLAYAGFFGGKSLAMRPASAV